MWTWPKSETCFFHVARDRNAPLKTWSCTATGCCCHVGTTSEALSMCAAQAEAVQTVEERPRTFLRPSHPRQVESSAQCKMFQLVRVEKLQETTCLNVRAIKVKNDVFFPHSTKVTAPTPSPSPDTDVEEADMEEEDDEVVEEEEDEEEDDVDEEEVEEEEEDEAMAAKDPEEYEYSFGSGPYQTSDYLGSFYYEKGHKPSTSAPLIKGDSCECFLCIILSFTILFSFFFTQKYTKETYVLFLIFFSSVSQKYFLYNPNSREVRTMSL